MRFIMIVAAVAALGMSQAGVPVMSLREEMRIVSNEASLGTSLTTVAPGSMVHPDGRIFTLHTQEAVVRVFDANGRFVTMLGRAGDGPGEFRRPFAMGMVGDSIWVFSSERRHYEIFGPDLKPMARLTIPRANISTFGLTAERTTLVEYGSDDTTRVVIHSADSSRVRQVQFRLKQKEHRFQVRDPGLPGTVRNKDGTTSQVLALAGVRSIESPLQSHDEIVMSRDGRDVFAIEPGETWGGMPGQIRISRVSMTTGQVSSPAVLAIPARRITNAERDSIIDAAARASARLESQVRSGARLPEFYPTFRAVQAMGDGVLWLHEYLRPQERVLLDARAGRVLMRLHLPQGLSVFAATRTHVWGTLRDANDLPIVVRYRIVQ